MAIGLQIENQVSPIIIEEVQKIPMLLDEIPLADVIALILDEPIEALARMAQQLPLHKNW